MNDNFNTGFEVVDFCKQSAKGSRMNNYNAAIHYDPAAKTNANSITLNMEITRQLNQKQLTNVLIIRNSYTGELTLVFNNEGNGAKFSIGNIKNNASINNSGVVKYIIQNLGYDISDKVNERINIGENKALDEEYMAFTISRQK